MSEVVNRYTYFFNSHQAENYNPITPFCEFQLQDPIKLSHPMNVFELSIPRAMIPYTFYQFSQARDSVRLTFSISSSTYNVFIPDGNYNIAQLGQLVASSIQTFLVANGFPGAVLIIAYNNTSNRLSFDLSNPSPLTLSFEYSKLGEALGFLTSFTLTSSVLLISAIDCNVAPINMLFVTTSLADGGQSYEQLRTASATTSIVASIPIIHSSKYYIPFEPASPIRTRLRRDVINSMDFNLLDNNGNFMVNFPLQYTFVVVIEELNLKNLFEHPTMAQQVTHNQIQRQEDGLQLDELNRLEQKALNTLNEIRGDLRASQSQLKKRKNV
jgi:hypothetical protein